MSKKCKKHQESPRSPHGGCLECRREKSREWNKKNRKHCRSKNRQYYLEKKEKISERKKRNYKEDPEKYKKKARGYQLKKQYNMTLEEYDELLKTQNFVCAICGLPETQHSNKKGKVDSLRVDHDHDTGKIRGLLCSRCNFGLGHFQDDKKLLNKAINYLKKHERRSKN